MDDYPTQSHLQNVEIVDDGATVRLRFIHKDDKSPSLISLTFEQLNELVLTLTGQLNQAIAIRHQHGKSVNELNIEELAKSMGLAQTQLHIAPDKSHVLFEFRLRNGATVLSGVPAKAALGFAQKIIHDLQVLDQPGSQRQH